MPPAMNPTPLLQADRICFSYPEHPLFADLSFSFLPGVSLVQGDEGTGKTTLLRLLAAVLPAHTGSVSIKGVSLHAAPPSYRAKVFWAEVRSDAHDLRTPRQYFDMQRKVYAGFDGRSLDRSIQGLGLSEHLDKEMFRLSTGSKRKVWLAAAFASGAELTLLDDPFAALDTASSRFVMGLLEEAAEQETRAVVVSGYEGLATLRLAGTLMLGASAQN